MADARRLDPRHVRLVAASWMRFSMRTGGGLMAIFLVLMSGLTVAHLFITPVEKVIEQAPEHGHTESEAAAQIAQIAQRPEIVDLVKNVTDQDEDEVAYLLRDQPALLSVIWLILLMLFPFVTALGAFNQTAGDIGSKGLRYLLLRTSRTNVYVGRSLGTLYFSAASLLLLLVLVLMYVGLKLRLYEFSALLGSGSTAFFALLFLCLPYIALCGWLSSLFESAFGSLAVCLVAVGGPILLFKLLDTLAVAFDLGWLLRLLPWGWKYDLLSGEIGTRLLAYGVMLGFTALFFFLGMRHFRRRDL